MQIDQKTLQRLLKLNDDRLSAVIQKVASDAGIDPRALGMDTTQIQSIREALGSVTDRDLEMLNGIYQSFKQGNR